MKRILYIIVAALLMVACGDKNGKSKRSLEEQLYGEWKSSDLAIDAEIYMNFLADKTFELYQKVGEGAHRLYRGTWNIEEDLLTGRYNDGEDWAAAYQVAIKDKTLTLTSSNDAAEKSTYVQCEIPAEVKDHSVVEVKSSGRMLNSQPQYRWL